jgi:hypothetical protein
MIGIDRGRGIGLTVDGEMPGNTSPREASCASLSRVVPPYGPCAFVANLPRPFFDQKEQDQANLKKRSQPIGLRSGHGQDAENATVIDLMKTAVVGRTVA